jgi:hypothetical protein
MNLDKLNEISERLTDWISHDDGTFFHKPDAPIARPTDRTEYILRISKGKRVLHFGFTDSPFTTARMKSGEMLHLKIKDVAKEAWGSDVDKGAINEYIKVTGDKNVFPIDVSEPIENIGKYKKNFDLLIFGETLEHVLNPGITLKNLAKICKVNGSKLLITTPNAFSVFGFLAAWNGNEIVHPEHYYYYSPVTLTRLLTDTGFRKIKISLYTSEATKDTQGITGLGLIAISEPK